MKNLLRILLAPAAMALAFAACNPAEQEKPEAAAPALVSTEPETGAEGLTESSLTVVFTYDQTIKCTLANTEKVTVSGGASKDKVYTAGNKLSVAVSGLERGKTYTVTVPAGCVEGFKENQKAAAQASVSFSMKEGEKEYGRDPQATLSNPKASAGAVKLYEWLLSNYGTKTLSGAMGGTAWETSYTDYIKSQTGTYPAIVGFDYLFNNWPPKAWGGCPDYGDITPVRQAWEAHNIIQIGWHWCVPSAEGTTDINQYSYSTKAFGVKNALTPGTWQNAEMKKQVAQIAGYLKLLKDAGIPVLWRPLHEAAGDYTWGAWFWWGYDGPEYCKKLWQYLYNEFTGTYGLDNLIWVWTVQTSDAGRPASVDKLIEWYPGDAYVDIVGADLYVAKNTTQSNLFKLVNNSVRGRKMVVASEFGNLLDIDGFFAEDAPWGYFLNWCNFEDGKPVLYARNSDGTYTWNNTAADWKAALENSHTVNRDDIPSF